MTKALKLKDVQSDIEKRMKEFEKLRVKKTSSANDDKKGLFSSISDFFAGDPKPAPAKK